MKKFASLVLTVVLLATMLTVIAIPAFAEDEPETPEEYMNFAAQLESEKKYGEAADAYCNAALLYMAQDESIPAVIKYSDAANAYCNAAQLYDFELDDYSSAGNAYLNAGRCFVKVDNWNLAASNYGQAAVAYKNGGDYDSAAEARMRAGDYYIKAGKWSDAAGSYVSAGDLFKGNIPFYSAAAYLGGAYSYQKSGNKALADMFIIQVNAILDGIFKFNYNTGSALSEGNLTIIVGIAAAVVFGLGGFILGTKKKKKTAVASGVEDTDEE